MCQLPKSVLEPVLWMSYRSMAAIYVQKKWEFKDFSCDYFDEFMHSHSEVCWWLSSLIHTGNLSQMPSLSSSSGSSDFYFIFFFSPNICFWQNLCSLLETVLWQSYLLVSAFYSHVFQKSTLPPGKRSPSG